MRSVGDHVRAGLAHGVTTHRGRAGSPGRLIVFVLSLLIACASYALVQAGPAHAAAAVSVSKSVSSKPLLGGQAGAGALGTARNGFGPGEAGHRPRSRPPGLCAGQSPKAVGSAPWAMRTRRVSAAP